MDVTLVSAKDNKQIFVSYLLQAYTKKREILEASYWGVQRWEVPFGWNGSKEHVSFQEPKGSLGKPGKMSMNQRAAWADSLLRNYSKS